MKARLKADEELEAGVFAFIEIGGERNRLIHQDLGHFALEKTADEIFALYERAVRFPDALPSVLASADVKDPDTGPGGASKRGFECETLLRALSAL